MVARSPSAFGLHPLETSSGKVDTVNERIYQTNRIVRANVVVHSVRQKYLDFVEDEKLKIKGPIRLVPINTREFVTALRWLDHAEETDFDSHLLATALDGIHRKLRGDIPADEEDWMANTLVDNIRKGMDKHPRLYEEPSAE